jgi:hypothetical protein
MVPKAKTVKGGITKGLTLFLLLSGPLLGEGFICILMASPIFYLVGLLLRPILIRTDMSNLNCHFRLLNASRNPPGSHANSYKYAIALSR